MHVFCVCASCHEGFMHLSNKKLFAFAILNIEYSNN